MKGIIIGLVSFLTLTITIRLMVWVAGWNEPQKAPPPPGKDKKEVVDRRPNPEVFNFTLAPNEQGPIIKLDGKAKKVYADWEYPTTLWVVHKKPTPGGEYEFRPMPFTASSSSDLSFKQSTIRGADHIVYKRGPQGPPVAVYTVRVYR